MIEFVPEPPDNWGRRGPTGFALKPYRQESRQTKIRKFSNELRENPGKWAEYPGNLYTAASAYSMGANIRRGLTKSFQPRGAFEARVRTTDTGIKVFVLYTGGTE